MKVEFLKNYTHGSKTFRKGTIAKLHWTLANDLIKKRVAKLTSEITEEDKVLKQIRDGDNGEN